MNRNKFLPIALAVGIVVIIGIVIWQVWGGGKGLFEEPWTGLEGDPINLTLDFYEDWLDARGESPEAPFTQGLLNSDFIAPELRERLAAFEGQLTAETEDPVLCQIQIPEGLRTRPVFEQEESAQLLITPTDGSVANQAVVDLKAKNGLWKITNITCGNAESGPEAGEFSFEKSGFLLKQVPEPLDSNNWHLIFEEAGVLGHAVPLFFSDDSVCVWQDGSEAECNDDFLKETMPALVKGEMSESGVEVKRVEMIESVSIN